MSDDYQRGRDQFAKMVGEENIEALLERFRAVCPDFEEEVVSVVGGRVWTRDGIDLKTRSLCSIGILAALGRVNALRLNLRMALNNGASGLDPRRVIVPDQQHQNPERRALAIGELVRLRYGLPTECLMSAFHDRSCQTRNRNAARRSGAAQPAVLCRGSA